MAPAGRSNRRGVRLRLTTKFTSRVSESRGVVKSVTSLSNSRPASADAANSIGPPPVGNLRRVGDSHGRRSSRRRAVGVERRPVHSLVAVAACPGGVPAACPRETLDGLRALRRGRGCARWVIGSAGQIDRPTQSRDSEPTWVVMSLRGIGLAILPLPFSGVASTITTVRGRAVRQVSTTARPPMRRPVG